MKTKDILNPTTMAEMIENNTELTVAQSIMVRNKNEGGVTSRKMDKRLRVTFSKRMMPKKPQDASLPIGSKWIC